MKTTQRKPWSEEARKRHFDACRAYQLFLKRFKVVERVCERCEEIGIDGVEYLRAISLQYRNHGKLTPEATGTLMEYLSIGMTGKEAYNKLVAAQNILDLNDDYRIM